MNRLNNDSLGTQHQFIESKTLELSPKSSVSLGQHLVCWHTNYGPVSLIHGRQKDLIAISPSETFYPIVERWIDGIPQHCRADANLLRKYLAKTYVVLHVDQSGRGVLRIHPRLKGGMLAAFAGGASAIGSTMGFLSSGNYIRLAREAGQQAQATLRIAGRECQAVIQTAESAANHTIRTAQHSCQSAIRTARDSTQEVLRSARSEIDGVVRGTGIETRHTARILELILRQSMQEAQRNVDIVLRRAGLETQQVLQTAGQEARDTTVEVGTQVAETIRLAREEGGALVGDCQRHLSEIIRDLERSSLAVIQDGGADIEERISALIDQGIQRIEDATGETIQRLEEAITRLVTHIATEVNTVVINAGEQGRLLVTTTGEQVEMRLNSVLAKAVEGGTLFVQSTCDRVELLAGKATTVVRSALKEVPRFAGRTAHEIGHHFALGLRQGFLGLSEVNQIEATIQSFFNTQDEIDSERMAKYVLKQRQLRDPLHKLRLYEALVQGINLRHIASDNEDAALFAYLVIGATACSDEGLTQETSWLRCRFHPRHLSEQLIERIPSQRAIDIIRERGTEALSHYLQEFTVPAEELDTRDLTEQQHQLEQAESIFRVQSLEGRLRYLEQRVQEERAVFAEIALARQNQIEQLEAQLSVQSHTEPAAVAAAEELQGVQPEIERLQTENEGLREKVRRLREKVRRLVDDLDYHHLNSRG